MNDSSGMNAFQTIIIGRFAPLVMMVDDDAEVDSILTHFNKVLTDTKANLLSLRR